jgi:outer membrane immunogenic protein
MRHAVAVGLALLALSAQAKSADMLLKAPSPPVLLYSWTGCYLGGNVGGIWSQNDTTNISFVDGGSGVAVAAAAGVIPLAFNNSGSGWIAGGQLGCNYQISNWVVGIETDMSGTNLNADQAIGTNVPPFFPLGSSVYQDMNWIGTTRGRLGWTWGSFLIYGTAGVAYANVNYAYAQNNTPAGPVAIAVSDSATQVGWTAGGGLEVPFGRWSVKGEYLFYDIGSHTLNAGCTTCTGLSPTVFSAHYQNSGSIARLGLNYRFY